VGKRRQMLMEGTVNYRKVRPASHKQLSLGVVIPCHNNSWQLSGVLKSLTYQSVRPEMVVVADDNSDPWEELRVRSLCRNLGAHYRKVPAPRNRRETLGRRSHARNLGTRCLDTDVVLYLDGDTLLGPKYVEEIMFYHAVLDKIYIRGHRYSIPAAHQAKGVEICLNAIVKQQSPAEILSVGYITRPQNVIAEQVYEAAYVDRWEWCASNNLSVNSAYVSQIGYWDEKFLGWGEEDIDFSFRLYQLGLTPLLLNGNNAVSYHLDHHIDYETNRFTLRENGRYLISKCPEIKEYRKEAYALYNINIEDFSQGCLAGDVPQRIRKSGIENSDDSQTNPG
jgi:predicted glycosyltransferase involved in capsule biosynthesis